MTKPRYLRGLVVDHVPSEDLAKLLEIEDPWRIVAVKVAKDMKTVVVYSRRLAGEDYAQAQP